MKTFPVLTPEQLPALLQGFRKASGLTQAEIATRLGITQQTMSAMERNADSMSVARLMKLLAVLGVELSLSQSRHEGSTAVSMPKAPVGKDVW
ncbi:MAG TPA: helix-turn-helix transcriptional regulator [Methylibium sp.]|uniref:helix-turn-helix domain-containing protein n=1 Tax=Methylibium sp. TaxID=2067992 RepID=UPI002DB9A27C|nr:helix-turn-helix transcriptional regulator [Methylibium sp.]HEU4457863.1 helix-turn-helix transcriptional regulator [Methylibium sp.]